MAVCLPGVSTNQVVIRPNAKEFPKVTKGNRSVGLKAKVAVVMSRSQVTAFTENTGESDPETEKPLTLQELKPHKFIMFIQRPVMLPTWGRRCFRPPQSPAWEHLVLPFGLSCQLCERCPTGWRLLGQMMWSKEVREENIASSGTTNNFPLWLLLFHLLFLECPVKGISKLILEYKHQTPFPHFTSAALTFLYVVSPVVVSTPRCPMVFFILWVVPDEPGI